MWISKAKYEDLVDRVRKLEKESKIGIGNPEWMFSYGHFGGYYDYKSYLSVKDVVTKLLSHLKLDFIETPAQEKSVTLTTVNRSMCNDYNIDCTGHCKLSEEGKCFG